MAGRLITSGPNKYSRPKSDANSILSASQFVTEFANEQQKIKEKKKLDAEKAKQDKALKQAQNDVNRLKTDVKLESVILAEYSKVINDLKNSFGPPPYDAGELALLNPAVTNFTQQKIILSKVNTRLTAADNLEKSINNQLKSSSAAAIKKEFDKKSNGKGKKSNNISGAIDDDIPKPPPQQEFTGYKYNVPMIRSEYFTDRSPQTKTTVRGGSGPGNWNDAIKMFSGTNIAKGTMQMPRDLTKSAAWKNKTGIYKEDSTMYGFKFLYNPTEVSMGWGMLETVDPNTIRSGAAGGLAPVSGVGLSTIDFTLLLNRISDMNFLDENGLAPGEDATIQGPYEGINPIQRVEDLKMIYKRGTMYDLEYLFRVINGPSAIHQTILNGASADWGFLIGSQVELFLGDGLRYVVRLNGISVNHRIFNDRMVPVISEVSISCGRYNDVGIKQKGDDRSKG
jgi:hypothetical protein